MIKAVTVSSWTSTKGGVVPFSNGRWRSTHLFPWVSVLLYLIFNSAETTLYAIKEDGF